jgi:branched-chain amino acid transport system ATP-binding protein
MLEVKDLNSFYGKSHIIQGITFDVSEGDVIGILGRNGVGKTTVLRSILGLSPPRRTGVIKLGNLDLSSLPPHKIAKIGVGYVPQGRRIFPRLTVMENLILPVTEGKVEQSHIERVFEYFPVLKNRTKQLGKTLSGGEQQMLVIGRAMMSDPKLIIIDEPTEGLQPSMVVAVRESIKALFELGITVIIADQNLENVLELCDKVHVLEKGIIRYQEIRENLSMKVLQKYLGVSAGPI